MSLSYKKGILETRHNKVSIKIFNNYFSINNNKKAGLDLLEEILSCFSQFPYENLSKIIKHSQSNKGIEKIRLPEELMKDHKMYHFGGTCFSLTYFLQIILTHFHFSCYPVMASMRWGQNVHCAMVVMLDNIKYLVDPGYLLNRPIQMKTNNIQGMRIFNSDVTGVQLVYDQENIKFNLFTFDSKQIKWRYSFIDRPVSGEDFLDYWLSSFNWNSMHGLCLTKIEKGRMVYIHKTFMRETRFGEKKNVNIKKNYHSVIQNIFGIHSVRVEEALAALELNMSRERESGLWVPKNER
jgi:arylamine N-acetyltransferase